MSRRAFDFFGSIGLAWSVVLVLAGVAIGCGPQGRTRLGEERTSDRVDAPAPGADSYIALAPTGDPVLGGADGSAVTRAVEAAATAANMPLAGDPRLATLSDWMTDQLGPGGEPPAAEVVEFFAWHLGLVEPPPHIIVLGLPNTASITEQVQASVARFMERHPYTHWGASVRARNGLWVIVVTLSWRNTAMEPVPRQLPAATPIAVRGHLNEGFYAPTLVVQTPDGQVRRLPAGSGTEFDFRVPTEASGRYGVEVLARGPQGESVVTNFPVYVGEAPPSFVSLRSAPVSTGGQAATADQVRTDLIRLINETRAQQGLPAVEVDARLDAVALAHSEDMAAHDFVAHTSPTTGTASDRVRAADLRSGLVLENIGRGYSAAEIHQGLLASPGHRANMINPDANIVGVGVVIDASDGQPAYIATQVFLRVAHAVDTAAAPAHLLELMNRARTARGAPPLTVEPNLQAAANDAAVAYFNDSTLTTQTAVDQASASMRRYAIAFRRVGGVMAVVSEVDEASQLEPTLADDVDYVGIGVAQGTRADTEPNAITVVIMLGWAR